MQAKAKANDRGTPSNYPATAIAPSMRGPVDRATSEREHEEGFWRLLGTREGTRATKAHHEISDDNLTNAVTHASFYRSMSDARPRTLEECNLPIARAMRFTSSYSISTL